MRALQFLYRKLNRLLSIRKNVHVGRNFVIGAGGFVSAPDRLEIGDDVSIGRNFWMACNGSIGSGTLISSYVGILGRRDHDMSAIGFPISRAPWLHGSEARARVATDRVDIEQDVWIGFGATILSGIRIGRGSVVAAGAVVVRDVKPYEIVGSPPARPIGMRFDTAAIARHEDALLLWKAQNQKPKSKKP